MEHSLPVKAKKKKSSFMEDDFFVVKKKKARAMAPVLDPPPLKLENEKEKIEKLEKKTKEAEKTEIEQTRLPPTIGASTCASPSSEDKEAVFFSATETFSDSPIDLAALQTVKTPYDPEELIDLSDDSLEVNEVRVASPVVEVPPDEDEEDSDLRSFFNKVSKSNYDEGDESKRLYNVKVISKLGFPLEYEKQISGNTTFAELIDLLQKETLREYGATDYWSVGCLVWVEGKSELKHIFKPSTLRIPWIKEQVSQITCLYVPREHLATFETLYPEFNSPDDAQDDGYDDQPSIYSLLDSIEENLPDAPISEYFIIGLKGKDNKRLEAEVGPTTKIRSILKHYLQVKGIKDATMEKCKLIFDDEELPLDSVVGDTELEEDFEIQVYIH